MPQFVLEVASESTWRQDVGKKRDLYRLAGVHKYLVFDPTGGFIPERVRAWRTEGDDWQPWPPVMRAEGPTGWESAVLGLALRVEGSLLRFDHPVSGPLPVRREAVDRWHATQQALRQRSGSGIRSDGHGSQPSGVLRQPSKPWPRCRRRCDGGAATHRRDRSPDRQR